MPRLWVREITSVGAVEEGDNPGAEILFFKKRDPDTGEGLDTQPKERPTQQAVSDVQRPERRIAERRQRRRRRGPDRRVVAGLVAKAIQQHQQRKQATMPKKKATTTAVEEVEELAKSRRLDNPLGPTLVQQRATIWKERPDLRDRARSEEPAEAVTKKAKPETLEEAVNRGFRYQVGVLQLQEPFMSMTPEKVRTSLYKTQPGTQLLELSRSHGKLPVTEAVEKISKAAGSSPDQVEALRLLRHWAGL